MVFIKKYLSIKEADNKLMEKSPKYTKFIANDFLIHGGETFKPGEVLFFRNEEVEQYEERLGDKIIRA